MSFWKVRKFSRLPINCRVFFSPNGTGAAVWQRKRKQHAFVKSAAMWVGLWGSKHGPCFQRAHWFNSEAFCPSLHFELFCPSCHSWNQPFAMESTCPRVGYKPETFRNCDQRGSDRTKELLIVPNSVGDIWPVKFDPFFWSSYRSEQQRYVANFDMTTPVLLKKDITSKLMRFENSEALTVP